MSRQGAGLRLTVNAQERLHRAAIIWSVAAWLIVGPFLCTWLLGALRVHLPVTHNDSIDIFGQTIPSSTLAGIAIFFLPYPRWQRVLAFVLYAPIAGVVTLIVALSIACYVFHDCL